MENKQLTPEELQNVQNLQTKYNQYIFELGHIEAQLQSVYSAQHSLESEKKIILEDLYKLSEKEKEITGKLQDKYGVGKVDPQTGEITPI